MKARPAKTETPMDAPLLRGILYQAAAGSLGLQRYSRTVYDRALAQDTRGECAARIEGFIVSWKLPIRVLNCHKFSQDRLQY